MKTIEIDDDLYHFIASNTQHIGESASSILRRLLKLAGESSVAVEQPSAAPAVEPAAKTVSQPAPTPAPAASAAATLTVAPAENYDQALLEIAKTGQKSAVRRFLSLLGAMYHLHPEAFSLVLEIRGRNRLYFALDREELLQSGRSTNPMAIPDSPYWVIGNTNTERKREILAQVLLKLGYTQEQIGRATELL